MGICFSCDIVAGRGNGFQSKEYVVELNGGWILDHCNSSNSYLGYLILVTKCHREEFDQLTSEESKSLGVHIQNINQKLREYWIINYSDDPIERVHIAYLNEGPFILKNMNESHVHFHILPRTRNMIPDYDGDKIGWHLLDNVKEFPKYLNSSENDKKNIMIYLNKSLGIREHRNV